MFSAFHKTSGLNESFDSKTETRQVVIPKDEERIEYDSQTPSWRKRLRKLFNQLFPLLILGGYGYLEYCYSYRFCWIELYHRNNRRAVAVLYLVVSNVLFANAMMLWTQIIIVGPGKLRIKVPPYDLSKFLGDNIVREQILIEPPDWFLCDNKGLPFWCTHCQSIKILRSHHSSNCTHCVPRFDHYCLYIGCVIGLLNYKLFSMFLTTMMFWFTFLFFSTVPLVPSIRDYSTWDGHTILNPNLILLLIVSGFWMVMTSALLVSHVILIGKNLTTLESMQLDRFKSRTNARRYVNFVHPQDGSKRVVIELLPSDNMYDVGFYGNACDLLGTCGTSMLLPFNTNRSEFLKATRGDSLDHLIQLESDSFSEKFKQNVIERFANGEGYEFGGQFIKSSP